MDTTYLHMRAAQKRLGLSDDRIVLARVEPDAHYSDGSGKLHPLWLTSTIDQHAAALQNVRRGKLPKGFEKLRRIDAKEPGTTRMDERNVQADELTQADPARDPLAAEEPADEAVEAQETSDAPGADDDTEAQEAVRPQGEAPEPDLAQLLLAYLRQQMDENGQVSTWPAHVALAAYGLGVSTSDTSAAIKALAEADRLRFLDWQTLVVVDAK